MKCTRYKCDSGLDAMYSAEPLNTENESAVIIAGAWCNVCAWCKEEYGLVGLAGGIKFVPIAKVRENWVIRAECCYNCRYQEVHIKPMISPDGPAYTCNKHNWKTADYETCPDFTSNNVLSIERKKPC